MELKDLLDSQGWAERDTDYTQRAIEEDMRAGVSDNIRRLINYYRYSIMLNSSLLAITVCLYFIKPVNEILLPIGLIASAFLFVLLTILKGATGKNWPDPSSDLKTVLTETLAYNQTVNRRQCQYHSWIITVAYAGGFLLGLILQGWTFEKMAEKWIVFIIMAVIGIGLWRWTRSKSFRSFNRMMSPRYRKIKKDLEEQLRYLSEE